MISNFFKVQKNNDDNIFLDKFWNYFAYLALLILLFVFYTFLSGKIENYEDDKTVSSEKNFLTNEFIKASNNFNNQLKSPYKIFNYVVKNNDNIQEILTKFNIKNEQKFEVIEALKKEKLISINAGKKIRIIVKNDYKSKKNDIINLIYPISNTLSLEVKKSENKFEIKKNILKLKLKEVVVSNKIEKNLYSSATKEGIEPNIIIEFARIYGFEVDFQRDIRKGDEFEIYYEKFLDHNNIVRDTGRIIYASMKVNGRNINLYNFEDKDGEGYYDLNGKSIVKSLMKTPINGARLSSSFGMRKHPILGFNKMHRGTDFAAPTGTPIMASGSGTVTRARWCGGGGNCVKIRHNSTYETIYAHMSKFARGVKEGKKVKQGQIIGYVGSTGLSTGPHLHYEVLINGKKVNSQKLKLPSGKILKGDPRKEFEISRIKIDLKLAEIKSGIN